MSWVWARDIHESCFYVKIIIMITIEEITDKKQKSEITNRILRSLPDWFEIEDGILEYVKRTQDMPFFATKNDGEIIRFIVIEDLNEWASEVYVMGVFPEHRGHGAGKKMIDFVWRRNQKMNKKYLIVKTLDESSGDKFYDETRKFYKSVGFLPLFATTDIWGKDNPCLFMIKSE